MSRKGYMLFVCLLLLLLLPGLSKAEKFGVKLSGGMNYLLVGDPNASLKGLADFLKDQANLGDDIPEGEFKKIHFGLDLEGDVIVYLTPRFGISLGSGYIYGMKGGDINKIISGGQTFTEEVKVSEYYVYSPLPIIKEARKWKLKNQ